MRRFFGFIKLVYYLLRPKVIFLMRTSHGMGDNLLLTMLLPILRKKKPDHKIVVETFWPDLFRNNPDADWVTDQHLKTTRRHIKPTYKVDTTTTVSIYEQMTAYTGEQVKAAPKIYLDKGERDKAQSKYGSGYIVVCPVGKATFTANRKEWGLHNFQQLYDLLDQYSWVQIGAKDDPLLSGCQDARGLPIRESAAVLSQARLFVGLEGGLMHLARSVDTPAVIIYGGFIKPEVSGYDDQVQIYQKVHCSPCFDSHHKHSFCDTMICMKAIAPQDVLDTIYKEELLEKTQQRTQA